MLISTCFHRSEARTVPNLLVATSSTAPKPADLYSDHRQGYYADGAYTAAPIPAAEDSLLNGHEDEEEEDPQEAYYTAFLARFRSFSSLLGHLPPRDLISSSASNTARKLSTGMKSVWRSAFDTMPTTTVLSQLPQESVLQGLQILESSLASGDLATKQFLGLWAWGLMARCRDAGQMGSEEIGILRDLAKRAVWLLRGLRAGMDYLAQEQAQDTEGNEMGSENGTEEAKGDASGDQEHEDLETTTSIPPADGTVQIAKATHTAEDQLDVDDPLAAAKASLLSSLTPEQSPATIPSSSLAQDATQQIANGHSPSADIPSAAQAEADEEQSGQAMKVYATLDMIITIVGELYGQRDLLEGRLVWGEIDLGNV